MTIERDLYRKFLSESAKYEASGYKYAYSDGEEFIVADTPEELLKEWDENSRGKIEDSEILVLKPSTSLNSYLMVDSANGISITKGIAKTINPVLKDLKSISESPEEFYEYCGLKPEELQELKTSKDFHRVEELLSLLLNDRQNNGEFIGFYDYVSGAVPQGVTQGNVKIPTNITINAQRNTNAVKKPRKGQSPEDLARELQKTAEKKAVKEVVEQLNQKSALNHIWTVESDYIIRTEKKKGKARLSVYPGRYLSKELYGNHNPGDSLSLIWKNDGKLYARFYWTYGEYSTGRSYIQINTYQDYKNAVDLMQTLEGQTLRTLEDLKKYHVGEPGWVSAEDFVEDLPITVKRIEDGSKPESIMTEEEFTALLQIDQEVKKLMQQKLGES